MRRAAFKSSVQALHQPESTIFFPHLSTHSPFTHEIISIMFGAISGFLKRVLSGRQSGGRPRLTNTTKCVPFPPYSNLFPVLVQILFL